MPEIAIRPMTSSETKPAPRGPETMEPSIVPIGWVAVGDPARILPPGAHDEIWPVQEGLDFPGTVYGLPRDASARERMERQAAWFGAHRDDAEVAGRG